MPIHSIESVSLNLRRLGINIADRKVRIACFNNSEQSGDLSLPSNCGGFGRIHHFRRFQGNQWPLDPLPIDPAIYALGLPDSDEILAQVFQNATCNLRCWYCYVDRHLISGKSDFSAMLGVEEMLDLYLAEQNRPPIIDLSGGQPDLVPEWILWFADILHSRGLDEDIYLWSDDNLTTDFLYRFLNNKEIDRLVSYKNYGRVGCFKGFDRNSFSFNTNAPSELFDQQFSLMRRLVESGFDVYGYLTLTSDKDKDLESRIASFVNRLQEEVHPIFPLRTVPQRIFEFTPTKHRIGYKEQKALEIQNHAVYFWKKEIERRFAMQIRNKRIYQHKLDVRTT